MADRNLRSRERCARNIIFVNEYLQCHPCVDCGETDTDILEFDHVAPGKKGNVSEMVWSDRSIRAIVQEIELCEVRCANCHRKATIRRRRDNG